ncbi:MAG TPA: hypothetical protein VKV15_19100 [Bryobacteraceae bacterium]|nr:hypothetical protein [Bryobacteraceae bacterium]
MLLAAACRAGAAYGTWKLNAARSAFDGDTQPRSFTIRIEPHSKGEVFTLDTTDSSGRSTTSSTILYLDGQPRDFQDSGCSGSQSSRRLDGLTIEIIRQCRNGDWTRIVRRLAQNGKQLVLEISEQHSGGPRVNRRLTFEKR